jgi:deoxyribonuclease V
MQARKLHDWDVSPAEARRLQEELASRVTLKPLPPHVELVAGADVSFSRELGTVFAAVLVFRFDDMKVLEQALAHASARFPYVPGLLTFREGPAVLKAFGKLRHKPDAVIFDGQGYAHPRRIGLACHMGLWLGLPTVGCAKSRLIGEHAEPGRRRGDCTPLLDNGEQIGVALRTRDNVKPVYVSPGHLADFPSSVRLVLDCGRGYRLPEPTRQAHITVQSWKRECVLRGG